VTDVDVDVYGGDVGVDSILRRPNRSTESRTAAGAIQKNIFSAKVFHMTPT
jgi:hypothetical protein